jgi:hypothetical protein
MKGLLLLIAILLTACGPSSKEKQEIAIITCNIMGESKNMDGAIRLKEINEARKKLGEDAFLLSDDAIQESLKYDFCEQLVLNNTGYEELFKSKLIEAKTKLHKSIDGFWFYKNHDDDSSEGYVFTAEFTNQKLIINKYDEDTDYKNRQFQMIFEYRAIDDTRFEIFGNENLEDDFIIKLDKESNSLRTSSQKLSNNRGEIKFTRPANLSREEINGSWLEHTHEGNFEHYLLTKRDDSSYAVYEELSLYHDKKTYAKSIYTCEQSFTHGFIMGEKCGDTEDYFFYFIVSADQNSLNLTFHNSGDVQDKRVRSDYKLPSPPKGYTKALK